MSARYTCFVISPIGEPNSPIRLAADDTFEYVIRPALDKYDFVVERADHIRGITDTITKEVVERIQRSDLCVVDLSGRNSNVMYECGRRHETGKPCILISRDESLPFDVVTHPVIRYSLEAGAKEVQKTIRLIQSNVQHFIDVGFERTGSRSLGDVFREVVSVGQRVDVLLKQVLAQPTRSGAPLAGPGSGAGATELIKKLGGVVPAINFALANRDPGLIDQLLPRVQSRSGANYIVGGLAQGAAIGSRVAVEQLEQLVAAGLTEFQWDVRAKAVAGYAAGASRLDLEERALPFVKVAVGQMESAIEAGTDIDIASQAMILNALQMIYHGAKQFEDAAKIGERILELVPDSQAYLYNQSLNHHEAGDDTKSAELIDRLVQQMRDRKMAEADDDHLSHAITVYIAVNRVSEARELFAVLESKYPERAQVLRAAGDFEALFK